MVAYQSFTTGGDARWLVVCRLLIGHRARPTPTLRLTEQPYMAGHVNRSSSFATPWAPPKRSGITCVGMSSQPGNATAPPG